MPLFMSQKDFDKFISDSYRYKHLRTPTEWAWWNIEVALLEAEIITGEQFAGF